ncbi:MAG: hypothetical protein JJD98_05665 [Polaromonas sp.]|nr:hypothetical protein [Polaromonas sp.]
MVTLKIMLVEAPVSGGEEAAARNAGVVRIKATVASAQADTLATRLISFALVPHLY